MGLLTIEIPAFNERVLELLSHWHLRRLVAVLRRRPQRSPERLQTHLWAPAITPIDSGSRWRRQRG